MANAEAAAEAASYVEDVAEESKGPLSFCCVFFGASLVSLTIAGASLSFTHPALHRFQPWLIAAVVVLMLVYHNVVLWHLTGFPELVRNSFSGLTLLAMVFVFGWAFLADTSSVRHWYNYIGDTSMVFCLFACCPVGIALAKLTERENTRRINALIQNNTTD
jgi:hypothetical protein